MAVERGYDIIVRVTVTARSRRQARALVARFLPDPADERAQPTPLYAAAPNFPIDSWALLTDASVTQIESNAKRDRVHWHAVEES